MTTAAADAARTSGGRAAAAPAAGAAATPAAAIPAAATPAAGTGGGCVPPVPGTHPPRARDAGLAPGTGGGCVPPGHVRVAIVGAGFGGIGAAVRLRQAGVTNLVVLEQADAVGGTWRDNTYPGCACDVPSHLYSFSFAPNPRWSHSFSRQPEIRDYLERVTDRFGVREQIAFGARVDQARWDAAARRWRLRTSRGRLTADVLVAATGPLSDPALPDIAGLDSFPGAVFHSSRWNHDVDLAGRTVAVVGTGASAVQIVPGVQPEVDRLVLFQRTPAWVLPRADRPISGTEKWLYRNVPGAQRLARLGIYLAREQYVLGFVKQPKLLRAAQRFAVANLHRAVSEPVLRAKLTPDYVLGCKRILLSNDYYPALAQPNVDVVAAGLAKVDGTTLTAADGTAHDVDAIVFATGFHTIDMPIAAQVFGADGRSLREVWGEDMTALRGTTVAGFPNLCLVVGPNTGLGHTSMIHIIESQLNYIVDYVRKLDRTKAAAFDVRPAAQERWSGWVGRRMATTVWTNGGCRSWYLNSAGRNPTLWPGTTWRFRRATRRVDLREYLKTGKGRP